MFSNTQTCTQALHGYCWFMIAISLFALEWWQLFACHQRQSSTLNVLYHTTPHQLCGCEVKDVHGLQSFISTQSEKSGNVLFILCLRQHILFTSAFSKLNSVISLEEWVLLFKLFTTATRKLRVKNRKLMCCADLNHILHTNDISTQKEGEIEAQVESNCLQKVCQQHMLEKKRKKASTQSVINIVLTLIPSHCDNWWALLLRSELPALVTNRAGTWKLPLSSVKSSNASCAEGNSFFPRTITPSMSNRKPNRQFGNNWKRNMYVFWILNFYQGSSFTTKTYIHVTILNYFAHDTVQKIIKIYLVFSGGGGGENTWKCNKYPQNGLVEKEAHHLRQLVQWHLNEQHDSSNQLCHVAHFPWVRQWSLAHMCDVCAFCHVNLLPYSVMRRRNLYMQRAS